MSIPKPQENTKISRTAVRSGDVPRSPLHLFEIGGNHLAFDPESGRFFRIDAVTSDILALLPDSSPDEIAACLEARYSGGEVSEAWDEIYGYVEEGHMLPAAAAEDHGPEPAQVKPRIVSLTLNVVSTCNLKCIYCWNKGGIYGRRQREKRMSEETALRAIDLALRNSREGDDLLVDFYGGEPLLNFAVLKTAMNHCKRIQNESARSFSFKVTTNGTLLDEEILRFFDKMGVSLGISIDGTKKVHNRNRPFPDGTGSWNRIQKRLSAAMSARNIHVSARATLVPPDLDMVKAVKSLFRQGFYDTEVEFASEACEAFSPVGFPRYVEKDFEDMKRQYLRFAEFYLKYALYRDEAIDVGISNAITRVLHECHRFSPCGAGSNFITVSENGDIYPCIGFVGMPGYRLGDVYNGIDPGLLERFRYRMRSVVYEADDCRRCWARYICAGNCPANNEQHNMDLFKPYRNGCEWLKFKLEVAMWLASELEIKTPSRLEGYRPA